MALKKRAVRPMHAEKMYVPPTIAAGRKPAESSPDLRIEDIPGAIGRGPAGPRPACEHRAPNEAPRLTRNVPLVVATTTTVVALPIALSLWLRAAGTIASPLVLIALAVALSLGLSSLGAALWQRRDHGTDLLFSELFVWGFLHRIRQERALTAAAARLGLSAAPAAAGPESAHQHRRELTRLAAALDGHDRYLNGHSRRVARYSTLIARELGLPRDEVARLRLAAALHDVGKLLTPAAILNKPGRLTDEEYERIKLHPGDGAELVASLRDPTLTAIVRHHHERLDGSGYPDRLCGTNIPLGARIVAVADTFDAITSARAYRGASKHAKAIAILREEAGTRLDAQVVRAFLACYAGNRPALKWAAIVASLRQGFATLGGSPAAAAMISAGKVAVVVGATVATAAAAATPARPAPQTRPRAAVATTAGPPARTSTRAAAGAHHRPAPAGRRIAGTVPRRAGRHAVGGAPAGATPGAAAMPGAAATSSTPAPSPGSAHAPTFARAGSGAPVATSAPAAGGSSAHGGAGTLSTEPATGHGTSASHRPPSAGSGHRPDPGGSSGGTSGQPATPGSSANPPTTPGSSANPPTTPGSSANPPTTPGSSANPPSAAAATEAQPTTPVAPAPTPSPGAPGSAGTQGGAHP